MVRDPEIVVHIYSGDEFMRAKRIPKSMLESVTRDAEKLYVPPVEVRVVG